MSHDATVDYGRYHFQTAAELGQLNRDPEEPSLEGLSPDELWSNHSEAMTQLLNSRLRAYSAN